MNEEKIKDETVQCKWCGKQRIPVKQKSNARGYGFYGICPICNRETVLEEIDNK